MTVSSARLRTRTCAALRARPPSASKRTSLAVGETVIALTVHVGPPAEGRGGAQHVDSLIDGYTSSR